MIVMPLLEEMVVVGFGRSSGKLLHPLVSGYLSMVLVPLQVRYIGCGLPSLVEPPAEERGTLTRQC